VGIVLSAFRQPSLASRATARRASLTLPRRSPKGRRRAAIRAVTPVLLESKTAFMPVLTESWSVNRTSVRRPFEAGWRPTRRGDQDLSAPPIQTTDDR
jgi:hypothetical protein